LAEAGAAGGARSELRTRVVSAALLAPVAIAGIVFRGFPFALLVTVVAGIAFWEWTSITRSTEPHWMRVGALASLVVGLFFFAMADPEEGPNWPIGLIALAATATLAVGWRHLAFLRAGLGLLYVGIPCIGFIVLRRPEAAGLAAVLFLLAVVWATDIGAYFGGRAIGGPKLWPRVSPKKTWSGAISGLGSAVIAAAATVAATGVGRPLTALLIALPLSIAAQAGDLFESAVKRRFGVKDSGRIIPGHGGVLDRVDGLFGAAAIALPLVALGLGGGVLAALPGASR
jgi:phosphatidate cytidylyltransferase